MIDIKIPWQVFACAGVVLIFSAAGYGLYDLGRDHNEEKWQAKVERGRAIVADLKAKQGSITISEEVRFVEKVKIIKEKADVIEKLVKVYIPVDSDLPAGFRVLYDSAALGTVPGAAEDGLPVSVRDVATTTATNFAICHQWKEALDGQVLWARQQRELYLSECKRLGQTCSTDN